MIGLSAIFWMYVILFGIIGAMRGWAKELLVTFSVILAIFLLFVVENFVPYVSDTLKNNPETHFWVRSIILIGTVFFGYQTPNLPRLAAQNRFARDKLQDILLGLFIGAINGYLVAGTFWWYLDQAQYITLQSFVTAPDSSTAIGQAALDLIKRLPPVWLTQPTIYFAVALAFAFVLIVFL